MHRPLPAERHSTVETRTFVVGQDEAAWLAVNNRAFAGHAEQSDWTVEELQRRIAMSWFDPAGFLLHERDGVLAAYCWTKMHRFAGDPTETDHPIGEIYVIGVDPAFQGLGLGSELTLAGLESLHDRGAVEGMLYVDGDNRPAQTMYERLGFTVTRRGPRLSRHDRTRGAHTPMTTTDSSLDELPRWSVADLHESLESRSFLASMEQAGADVDRIVAVVRPLGHARRRSPDPDRRRRPCRRRGDRGLQRRGRPVRVAGGVRLRHGQHRQLRRAGAGAAQPARSDDGRPQAARRPPRRLGARAARGRRRTRRAGGGQ